MNIPEILTILDLQEDDVDEAEGGEMDDVEEDDDDEESELDLEMVPECNDSDSKDEVQAILDRRHQLAADSDSNFDSSDSESDFESESESEAAILTTTSGYLTSPKPSMGQILALSGRIQSPSAIPRHVSPPGKRSREA